MQAGSGRLWLNNLRCECARVHCALSTARVKVIRHMDGEWGCGKGWGSGCWRREKHYSFRLLAYFLVIRCLRLDYARPSRIEAQTTSMVDLPVMMKLTLSTPHHALKNLAKGPLTRPNNFMMTRKYHALGIRKESIRTNARS